MFSHTMQFSPQGDDYIYEDYVPTGRALPTTFGELIPFLSGCGKLEWAILIMSLCAIKVIVEVLWWLFRPARRVAKFVIDYPYRITRWILRRVWLQATLTPEYAPKQDQYKHLILQGPATFRTVGNQMGVYGFVDVGGILVDVLVNPEWFNYLPDAIMKSRKEEAAVDYSPTSPVDRNAEPRSLVTLQSESGKHLGVGARVNYQGSTVLLTCAHVLMTSRRQPGCKVFICKQNKQGDLMRLELPADTVVAFGHSNPNFDAVALEVDPVIWSKLGVGAARVVAPRATNTTTQAFGFQMGKWHCSTGTAIPAPRPGSFYHTCSTQAGWSGSPLYCSQDTIVGLHRAAGVIGRYNLATILFPLFEKIESPNPFKGFSEIRSFEMDERRDVEEIDLVGRGRYRFTATEFVRPNETYAQIEERLKTSGRKLWSDMLDDAPMDFDEFVEATDSLNYQRGSEIHPTPSIPESESPALSSSRVLPPPRRIPSLVTSAATPATASPPPADVPATPVQPAAVVPVKEEKPTEAKIENTSSAPLPDAPSVLPQQLTQQLSELDKGMADTYFYAQEASENTKRMQIKLEESQSHLRLELTHQFQKAIAELENTLIEKLGSQLACLSTKLDVQPSDSESAKQLTRRPRSRQRRSASPSSTNTRGQSADPPRNTPPLPSKQKTTAQYQPRQT